MEIKNESGSVIGRIVTDYCSNCSYRMCLKVYKGSELLFVISERNCNLLTYFLGEGCCLPPRYYFQCCPPKGEACLRACCCDLRMMQTNNPYQACEDGVCFDSCFWNTNKGYSDVKKSCTTPSVCWHTNRIAVWDKDY